MKKKFFANKLVLNKTTVASLTNEEMDAIRDGSGNCNSDVYSCYTYALPCCPKTTDSDTTL